MNDDIGFAFGSQVGGTDGGAVIMGEYDGTSPKLAPRETMSSSQLAFAYRP